MAMIQCPECQQEISDKATKCIHCGKVLVEEVQPQKFCSECGKEIPVDSQECPFCGCPIEPEKADNPVIAKIKKVGKKAMVYKKPLIIVAAVAVIAIVVGLIINFTSSILNDDEQLAYQNAVQMKNMMKDPDSFRLYDEMFLLKHFNDEGENDFTYTIFKYGGANTYGAITTDEAIFKNGEYIMDYADEPDEDDNNYIDQILAKGNILMWQMSGDDDTWKMVDIDIEKIKDKMGLE